MKPYYEAEGVVLYHGDCREVLATMDRDEIAAVVTDPPYGIAYSSGRTGYNGGTALPGIVGDEDTSLRDAVIEWVGDGRALVFGTWKRPRPANCRMVLIWEKGDHVGMGDLSTPWKPNTEEIYVIGRGFSGHRGSSVLRHNAAVSWNSVSFGRKHPHEKPVALMMDLVRKCPEGLIVDPFAGSGSTGEACIKLGRPVVLGEISEAYCEIAAKRLESALTDQRNSLPFATAEA